MAKPIEASMETLHLLKSTEAPLWLAPSPSLAQAARTASQQLFSTLKPHVPKSPFDQLLVDGFDAEQIWQQIDLLQLPLLSSLRRQVKHWERNPEELKTTLKKKNENLVEGENKGVEEEEAKRVEEVGDDEEDADMDGFDDDDDDDDDDDVDDDDEEEEKEEKQGGENGIEDKFLKIKELEEYLKDDEAREYGLDTKKKKKGEHIDEDDDYNDDDDEEKEQEDDDVEDDELGTFDDGEDEEEDADTLGNARYEDFFGSKRKSITKKGSREHSESDDEQDDDSATKRGGLSTHEKQLEKLQSEIGQMEKANLEPKTWTMQGEVTAASRPKNSALEVDLDFEHNARPPHVITDEVTASLEDMIKNRTVEGRFDDIEKAPSLPSKSPRELKELDENKSKKGLAEVYEEEYVQKTNPAVAPLSFSDKQKKEASMLFKKLCLKLDALSHFHFAPKPVIEEMSIQTNVPALAMEEIAPMAVSDAAMLAPEEIFLGKGDIKEETELTQAERKRRRAKKKRKFKADASKRMVKKAKDTTSLNQNDGKED
ncbi:hypothetical protein K2173_026972 [Erythroxylum novogranatense]|uniref:U3 small nucleolar ribonucleoprotein protein MPP10 n=1 Tax=Erythroxylum novogranatense TaxID=1862640 RepID=A0AAV8U150_9ROSI|nr:hypothetical protein K2173_026972 [Erythroxylum novogranatense]